MWLYHYQIVTYQKKRADARQMYNWGIDTHRLKLEDTEMYGTAMTPVYVKVRVSGESS